MNNILNKGRERLCLVGFPGGQIGDEAGVEIHLDLVPGLNIPSGLVTFQDGQADVDGVAVKNPGKGGGDDAGNAAGLDGDGRMLAGGAAAEIRTRETKSLSISSMQWAASSSWLEVLR